MLSNLKDIGIALDIVRVSNELDSLESMKTIYVIQMSDIDKIVGTVDINNLDKYIEDIKNTIEIPNSKVSWLSGDVTLLEIVNEGTLNFSNYIILEKDIELDELLKRF